MGKNLVSCFVWLTVYYYWHDIIKSTDSSCLKQLEKSPARWYFFLGCGGRLVRSCLASGVAMVTVGRLPVQFSGELDRLRLRVLNDDSLPSQRDLLLLKRLVTLLNL